jgi:hypothetical protein
MVGRLRGVELPGRQGVNDEEEKLRWDVATLRAAIAADWLALASRNTADPAKRKAVRDHLDMSTCALSAATEKLRDHMNDRQGAHGQGIVVDLDRLASHIMAPQVDR